MNIVILGPQGSGKGTQAKMLAHEMGLFHMESGKMLREFAKTDKRIRDMLNKGILVPDEETLGLVEKHLTENNDGFENIIFDGYPRTLNQYALLKSWIESKGKSLDIIVYLKISDEEGIKRLSSRRTCESCGEVYNLVTNPPPSEMCNCGGILIQRDDDMPETIKDRLQTFRKMTSPILELAKKDGLLIEVDGERPIDVIYKEIRSKVKNIHDGR